MDHPGIIDDLLGNPGVATLHTTKQHYSWSPSLMSPCQTYVEINQIQKIRPSTVQMKKMENINPSFQNTFYDFLQCVFLVFSLFLLKLCILFQYCCKLHLIKNSSWHRACVGIIHVIHILDLGMKPK